MFTREDLLSKMHVREIDTLLYQGDPLRMGLKRVFGGQVLGQALNSAMRTVDPERLPHSLHAYFLRPGDTSRPILYKVDPIRDGGSFSTRRVVAKQRGKPIFNASISFQKKEEGLEHQMDLPRAVPDPDLLRNDNISVSERLEKTQDQNERAHLKLMSGFIITLIARALAERETLAAVVFTRARASSSPPLRKRA